jgi:hypothetical protein
METFDEKIFTTLKFSKRVIDYSCDYIASRILMVIFNFLKMIKIFFLGNKFHWLSNLSTMAQVY